VDHSRLSDILPAQVTGKKIVSFLCSIEFAIFSDDLRHPKTTREPGLLLIATMRSLKALIGNVLESRATLGHSEMHIPHSLQAEAETSTWDFAVSALKIIAPWGQTRMHVKQRAQSKRAFND
jgi:hypothetical protein